MKPGTMGLGQEQPHDGECCKQRRADADLRFETAALLQDLADRIRAGQVRRWQIETVLPSLRMVAAVLRETPRKGMRNGG